MQQTGPPVTFNSFKDSLSHGMTFLKRRFSSDDLAQESDGDGPQPPQAAGANPYHPQQQRQQSVSGTSNRPPPPSRQDFSLQGLGNAPKSAISAPTSPAKSQGPAAVVQGLTRNILQAATQKSPAYNKDRCKCLLVIDDSHVDWSKYFRGRKVLGDWDLRVEQSDFRHISMVSSGSDGAFVYLEGGKVFKPDFVFVRQTTRNCDEDWRSVIVGLLYGGVPGLNSMQSLFNFADRPWVFSHLLMIYRRMGPDKFPLIDQTYTIGRDRISAVAGSRNYPLVVKSGYAHGGIGKIKVNNPVDLADVESVLSLRKEYSTAEPYVDAKYDIHVQKIGLHYKAFMRKGISSSWKSNQGSAMLEQVAVTDRYKLWVDEVSQLFGGVDVCSVAALVAKDGREYIYEANDCTFPFLGDTQEEDRRAAADLVLQKMNHILGVKMALQQKENMGAAALQNYIKHESPAGQQQARPPGVSPGQSQAGPVPQQQQPPPPDAPPPRPRPPPPRQSSTSSQGSLVGSGQPGGPPGQGQMQQGPPPQHFQQQQQQQFGAAPIREQIDDTMGNLKKTFAGIFGDM